MKWICKEISVLVGVLAIFVTGCSTVPSQQVSSNQIEAAWVVLGDGGQAVARVITQATACPMLHQDGVATQMQVRAQPATVAQRPTVSSKELSKPSAFPILTCELALKGDVTSVSVAEKKLAVPKATPLKIVVLGDTGCRLKASSGSYQACNNIDAWPFSRVAKTAAEFAPDLVVHVGDYQYRDNPCPEGDSGCSGSPWGYGWDTWQADFFEPAKPLLAAAPWVTVRGNHEICTRAGQGWWRFMDARTLQPGHDCNLEQNDILGNYSAPYAVPIGGGAQLIVFDSSKVPMKPLARNNPAYQIYTDQLKAVDKLTHRVRSSLFVSHHPVLGFSVGEVVDGIMHPEPGNAALQEVLEEFHPKRLFAPSVPILLAGHIHTFEAITFATDHPTQFVIGNGGSSPIKLPAVLPPGSTPFAKAKVAQFHTTHYSGFTTMERASADATEWLIKSWDENGKLLNTCWISDVRKECG